MIKRADVIGSGKVDMVCFTGSVPAGRQIEQAAAEQFIPVGLEARWQRPGLCAR